MIDNEGHHLAHMNTSGDVIMGELYADDRHVATYNIGVNMTFFIHSDWLGTERARSEYNKYGPVWTRLRENQRDKRKDAS